MQPWLNQLVKQLLIVIMLIGGCSSIGFAAALDSAATLDSAAALRSISVEQPLDGWANPPGSATTNTELRSVLRPIRWVKDDQKNFRSKADVVQQVKRQYNATVLKISLNEQREMYKVRLLMQNGRVRDIEVSARR